MMSNKIPVVLVFCLVAVSVSLAQPVVEHGVSDTWQSFTADKLRIVGKTSTCIYRISNCDLGDRKTIEICKIENEGAPDPKECPAPTSKTITLERTGDTILFFRRLKLTNPTRAIPTSQRGNIFYDAHRKSYFADYPPSHYIFIHLKEN
eukprot:Nk52_evm1s1180 gene=Nk52_evmTU1s1180